MRRPFELSHMPLLFVAATGCVLAALACPLIFALVPARIGRRA